MARIAVDGVQIAYEIIGDGKRAAIITPGGRFSKDTPGMRELAEKLAEGDFRTVIWDRPNCGESDICFECTSESVMNADMLAGLLRELKMPRALVIGGSAGARVSLLAAIRHPEVVERLVMLWISGGVVGIMVLVFAYYHDSLVAVSQGGMEAVAAMPAWKPFVDRDPRNREYLLRYDPKAFRSKMIELSKAFIPDPSTPVPGLDPAQLRALKMPVMVFRSGESDPHHTRETSEAIAQAIPGAMLVEPPWGDKEWLERMAAQACGEGLFAHWPLLAPQILEFAKTQK
jgi:pimeloyl-ACP methyl ester carboxylesterase